MSERKPRGVIGRFKDAFSNMAGSFFTGSTQPAWYLGNFSPSTYGTGIDYQHEAGDLTLSSLVMPFINWISTSFTDAPLTVVRPGAGDTLDPIPGHALTALIDAPNGDYPGLLMWQPTLLSYYLAGNAYWLKGRNRPGGRVTGLRYEPHYSIRCISMPGEFISFYQVYRKGVWLNVDKADVVHFRNGLNPFDTRYGLGPLASALREVYTDNQAARFSAMLLRNMGLAGVVISPDGDTVIGREDRQAIKDDYMQKTTGDHIGEPLIFSVPMKLQTPQNGPSTLDVDKMRDKPEERVAALLKIHPAVVGFGVGLDRSTFSNIDEAFEAAWRDNLVPAGKLIAAALDTHLLPDFSNDSRQKCLFDTSKVQALQENRSAKFERATLGYNSGWLKRGEARGEAGYQADPTDDEYKPIAAITQPGAWMPPDPALQQEAKPAPPKPATKELAVGNGYHKEQVNVR